MKEFCRLLMCAVVVAPATVWAQGVWERRADYPVEATEVSAAVIGGKVYAVCGFVLGGSTNALYIYDPFRDAWQAGAPIPIAGGADHCNVAAAGGKLYLVGGFGGLAEGATYEYDPAADRWEVVGRMPTPRGASGVAALGNRIVVAGGQAGGRSVSTVEVFDTELRQWSRLPDMPTARDHLTAQVVNGKFYALAGRVGSVLGVNEEYDPAGNSWRQRAPLPTPRAGLGSGTVGNRIQVFGGEGPSGTPTSTYPQNEEYDPGTDTWRALAPLPTPRHGLYGATVAGVLFAPSGGPIQGLTYSNAHEAFYLPPAEPPVVNPAGVVNAASLSGALSPGTVASVYGRRLAPLAQAAFRLPLPTQMNAVTVKINGSAAPLLYVGAEQINFHLPHQLEAGPSVLSVTQAGVESALVQLSVAASSPGIFTLTQDGQGQGAILTGGQVRPARRGETVEIYCTGLGRVSDPPAPGRPAGASPLSRTLEQPVVTIGGVRASVAFSGLAPGLAGVYQVNAVIPAGAPVGARVAVQLRVGETGPASNSVTMGVE